MCKEKHIIGFNGEVDIWNFFANFEWSSCKYYVPTCVCMKVIDFSVFFFPIY